MLSVDDNLTLFPFAFSIIIYLNARASPSAADFNRRRNASRCSVKILYLGVSREDQRCSLRSRRSGRACPRSPFLTVECRRRSNKTLRAGRGSALEPWYVHAPLNDEDHAEIYYAVYRTSGKCTTRSSAGRARSSSGREEKKRKINVQTHVKRAIELIGSLSSSSAS